MKLNKRSSSKNINKLLLFAIMFIGLGFAALSATLVITGITRVGHISFDVHFENVRISEGSMKAETDATINESDNTQIDFRLQLTTPGEFYEFSANIVNSGTLDAYLSSIELQGLKEEMPKYLEVTYKYVNGGKIGINDLLSSGETERIRVRIEFKYDISNEDLPVEGTDIDLGLRLTYTQDNGKGIERNKTEYEVNILGQKMKAYIDNTKSEYVTSSTGINFSITPSYTNGKGLYLRSGTEYDEYPIFYYRGVVDNNNVLFGGFCWKIVRTTELGGTKLIYDGIPNKSNKCNNTGIDEQLNMTSKFSYNSTALADVGYMYGTRYAYITWEDEEYIYGSDVTYDGEVYTLTEPSALNTATNIKTKHYTCKETTTESCGTVYYVYSMNELNSSNIKNIYAIELTNGEKIEDVITNSFENIHDSAIKKTIDTWFASNLLSQERKLEDAVWCNDRSIASGGYLKDWNLKSDSHGRTYFSGYGTRHLITSSVIPALKNNDACSRKEDRFTKNDITNGNGALKYPVGLLTADEATIAGNGWSGYSTFSYLYTGQTYWTLSPFYAAHGGSQSHSFLVSSSGYLNDSLLDSDCGIRPSIVLKRDIVATSGDGTSSNPYVVE